MIQVRPFADYSRVQLGNINSSNWGVKPGRVRLCRLPCDGRSRAVRRRRDDPDGVMSGHRTSRDRPGSISAMGTWGSRALSEGVRLCSLPCERRSRRFPPHHQRLAREPVPPCLSRLGFSSADDPDGVMSGQRTPCDRPRRISTRGSRGRRRAAYAGCRGTWFLIRRGSVVPIVSSRDVCFMVLGCRVGVLMSVRLWARRFGISFR